MLLEGILQQSLSFFSSANLVTCFLSSYIISLGVQIIPGLLKLGFVFLFLILIVYEGGFQKMELESSMLSHHNPENHGGDILAFAVIITIQTFEKKNTVF